VKRALISWSGGKDSAWAFCLAREASIEPVALPAGYNEASDEIPMPVVAACKGADRNVFGGISLADRTFGEGVLSGAGLTRLFQLGGCESGQLARDMVASGINAASTAVDERRLLVNAEFLADVPSRADTSGENGEFHTVVWL
jgi:diphthamide synthase (EF-2-diphthine--ammonia ligase)